MDSPFMIQAKDALNVRWGPRIIGRVRIMEF